MAWRDSRWRLVGEVLRLDLDAECRRMCTARRRHPPADVRGPPRSSTTHHTAAAPADTLLLWFRLVTRWSHTNSMRAHDPPLARGAAFGEGRGGSSFSMPRCNAGQRRGAVAQHGHLPAQRRLQRRDCDQVPAAPECHQLGAIPALRGRVGAATLQHFSQFEFWVWPSSRSSVVLLVPSSRRGGGYTPYAWPTPLDARSLPTTMRNTMRKNPRVRATSRSDGWPEFFFCPGTGCDGGHARTERCAGAWHPALAPSGPA